MNERKQLVIKKAHQLFMEKGFQATSIQDILDYTEISKGTFYNYFSSKNELLIAIIKNIFEKLKKQRNDLLIGQDPANIEIFIQQMNLQLKTHRVNKLIPLFEEVLVSHDEELKQFLKEAQFKLLQWVYSRFIEIFGENKQDYLLDCAIMFMGILHSNLKYFKMAYETTASTDQIVRYSVKRIVKIVNEVSEADERLLPPEVLEKWLPNSDVQEYKHRLLDAITTLKRALLDLDEKDQTKYTELLDFLKDELLNSSNPRVFLIDSALQSIKVAGNPFKVDDIKLLEELCKIGIKT
ncbi:TetR/AcrR family transcriptional regulator [Anaerobacillus alkaliphilus]|uniref:TetR/AcrR family transcriptional regulator n=1 Tax=Anaerobacillus alkaliphilus TaxID=1548597 RepID=A0A4Q0VWG2_9BACI|nr:TetR/AcrR family transcriptional regulator [Anaerobacillus alkaliphilus]RXJ02535.1 TetR/AcrR family transcriptional regulator [Anaerobacillus alkaliphilus]